jgi:hypothetical protein
MAFAHTASAANLNQTALVDPAGGEIPIGTATRLDNPNLNGQPGALAVVGQFSGITGSSFTDPVALYYDTFNSCNNGCNGSWWIVDASHRTIPTGTVFDVGVLTQRTAGIAFENTVSTSSSSDYTCFGAYPDDGIITPVADPFVSATSRGAIVMPGGVEGIWNSSNGTCMFHENNSPIRAGEGFNVWFPYAPQKNAVAEAGTNTTYLTTPSNQVGALELTTSSEYPFLTPTYDTPVYDPNTLCANFSAYSVWNFVHCSTSTPVFPTSMQVNVAQLP